MRIGVVQGSNWCVCVNFVQVCIIRLVTRLRKLHNWHQTLPKVRNTAIMEYKMWSHVYTIQTCIYVL